LKIRRRRKKVIEKNEKEKQEVIFLTKMIEEKPEPPLSPITRSSPSAPPP
jgi:hypothetical protein